MINAPAMSRDKAGVELRAHAKINLHLEILGRRENGYHDIRSVVAPISLADTVVLEPADDIGTVIEKCGAAPVGEAAMPGSDDNLATRAARVLQKHCGVKRGVRIRLQKRIPLGGGLGGGSADAAAVLAGANRLWQTGLSREALMRVGSQVGCDVPALVHGGMVLMEGLGEQVTPLSLGRADSPDGRWWLVVVNPGFCITTEDIYSRVTLALTSPGGAATSMVSALKDGDLRSVAQGFFNGLQETVVRKYPLVGMLVEQLRRAGALGAIVSGSGASVFGLASDEEHANNMVDAVAAADGTVWSRVVSLVPDGVMAAHGPLEA